MGGELVERKEHGEIRIDLQSNGEQSKVYTGSEDLVVIVKGRGIETVKLNKKKALLHGLTVSPLALLGGLTVAFTGFEMLGAAIMSLGVFYGLGSASAVVSAFSQGSGKERKKIESKGRGNVIQIPEIMINGIVKLESGKIKRVYQLIDDKKVLEMLKVEDIQLIEREIPIALIDDKITEIIADDVKVETLSVEQKAMYNIGKTIPKLSDWDTMNVLRTLKEVYGYKIKKEDEEEYDRAYQRMLEDNKNLDTKFPALTGSKNYLKQELNNVSTKVNTELKKNADLVKVLGENETNN